MKGINYILKQMQLILFKNYKNKKNILLAMLEVSYPAVKNRE
jgi:hypothetical protein